MSLDFALGALVGASVALASVQLEIVRSRYQRRKTPIDQDLLSDIGFALRHAREAIEQWEDGCPPDLAVEQIKNCLARLHGMEAS